MGHDIIVEGDQGDTFYIISEGQVRITKRVEGNLLLNIESAN